MTVLSFSQIEQLWTSNGGSPAWAPVMAGIAIAESGGSTTALNNTPSTGDYSVGLWQINYYGSLNSSRTAKYGPSAALLNDPNKQAQAAINLSNNGLNLGPWKTDIIGNAFLGATTPPSASTVQNLISSGGLSTASPTSAGSPCSANPGWKIATFTIINGCQLQALKGATLMTVGGVIMLIGMVGIAAAAGLRTKAGSSLAQAVPGGATLAAVSKGRTPPSVTAKKTVAQTEVQTQRSQIRTQEKTTTSQLRQQEIERKQTLADTNRAAAAERSRHAANASRRRATAQRRGLELKIQDREHAASVRRSNKVPGQSISGPSNRRRDKEPVETPF
jgi:lysozyme-like protein